MGQVGNLVIPDEPAPAPAPAKPNSPTGESIEVSTTRSERAILREALGLAEGKRGSEAAAMADEGPDSYRVIVGSPSEAVATSLIAKGLAFVGAQVNNGKAFYVHVTPAGRREVLPRMK